MKKKLLIILSALFVLMALTTVSASAAIEAGSCGDNASWMYIDNSLTIYGSGDMYSYSDWDEYPWCDYWDEIYSIEIEDGITSIGDYAFYKYYYVDSISIGKDVKTIGKYAFYEASYYKSGVNLVIPEGVQSIGEWAFYKCLGLNNVWIKGSPEGSLSIGRGAFKGSNNITNLALGTVEQKEQSITLGYEAFEETYNLENLFMSSAVTEIADEGFCDDGNISDVYYLGTEDQWGNISIGSSNSYMTDKTRHYFKDIYSCHCDESGYWLKKNVDFVFSDAPFSFPDQTSKYAHNQKGHDEYTHWSKYPNGDDATLPNGKRANEFGHTIVNGVCSCGATCNSSFSYVDEQGGSCSINDGFTFLGNSTTTLENGWYICAGEFDYGDRRLQVKGDVKLILLDRKGLKTSGGIHINDNASLTIYSETLDTSEGNAMGYITVTGAPKLCAGIGTDKWGSWNNNRVVICGGNIDCRGGEEAAGIGSGQGKVYVTIYNGHISAVGGCSTDNGGAGIGSGAESVCDAEVVIRGGHIYASSLKWGAGIGSGSYGANCYVKLYGGDIKAETSGDGAPIGSGYGISNTGDKPSNCTVDIYGGNFDLHSQFYNKTIGAGHGSRCTVHDYRGGGSVFSNGSLIIISVAASAAIAVGVVLFVKKKHPQNMA